MSTCEAKYEKTVPLYRVVSAAVVDTYENIDKVQQTYSHWAARGLKKLNREILKTGKRYVTLTVNKSTNTATLPADFDEETFVGIINSAGKKVPLKLRPDIVDLKNIEDIACEDKCEKCKQSTSICNDLTITEDTTLVVIGDSTYEQTVIKKLYPDGKYFLETRIPVLDVDTDSVIYSTTKQFITELDLKSCGCIDDTAENIEKIKCCCYDAYCAHYATCDSSCTTDYGGYRIFEETGLIQFDGSGFNKVYLEYKGFMPKKNGQYQVPEIAFETLVNWTKFKSVENKRNIPLVERDWFFRQYDRERRNMEKIMGRISLSQIIQAIGLTPKFDVDVPALVYGCTTVTSPSSQAVATAAAVAQSEDCDSQAASCPPVITGASFTPFDIAEIAGIGDGPTPGTHIYQNNKLKGAIGVNMIVVNNTNETIKALQFTIDTVAGTISRFQGDGVTPNDFQAGDVFIVPTFFKLI